MANEDLNKELLESIAYFEQILDVLPGERTALEFLCVACSQLGDEERFLKYALTLADVILKEKNAEAASDLLAKLESSQDPRAQATVLKLRVLVAPKPDFVSGQDKERLSSAGVAQAVKAELELLNRLVTDKVLMKEQVKLAFDQLENPPENEGEFLISALAILEKENLPGATDAFLAVADAAHAPPVPLEAFELKPKEFEKLPERLIRVRGVVPFAKLKDEWAVAVLNPLDETLKREIAEELGAKCHFFLALPAAVEKAIAGLGEEEAAPEGAPVPAPAPAATESPAATEAEPAPVPAPATDVPKKPKLGIRRPIRK